MVFNVSEWRKNYYNYHAFSLGDHRRAADLDLGRFRGHHNDPHDPELGLGHAADGPGSQTEQRPTAAAAAGLRIHDRRA